MFFFQLIPFSCFHLKNQPFLEPINTERFRFAIASSSTINRSHSNLFIIYGSLEALNLISPAPIPHWQRHLPPQFNILYEFLIACQLYHIFKLVPIFLRSSISHSSLHTTCRRCSSYYNVPFE